MGRRDAIWQCGSLRECNALAVGMVTPSRSEESVPHGPGYYGFLASFEMTVNRPVRLVDSDVAERTQPFRAPIVMPSVSRFWNMA